jgi:hypothetical protein
MLPHGLDLHTRSIRVAPLNEQGQVLARRNFPLTGVRSSSTWSRGRGCSERICLQIFPYRYIRTCLFHRLNNWRCATTLG